MSCAEEILKRAFKYISLWLILLIALKYVPQNKLNIEEILKISFIGVVSFGMLDLYYPAISKIV